jgi:DNA primase
MALKAGLEVRFLTLAGASKLDPDLLFLERGLPAYAEVRRGAQSAMTFACRATLPDPANATSEHKTRAAQTLYELIAAAESQVARSQFLSEVAIHLRLPLPALAADFNTAVARQNRQVAARPAPPTAAPAPALVTDTAEHHLLMLALNHEQLGPVLARTIPHEWIDTGHIAGNLLNRVLAEFEQNSWPGREHLDSLLETAEERTLVATLIFNALELDDPGKVAAAGLQQLRARALEPRLRQIELALANPQPDSAVDPISLLKERSELQRQLRQPITLNLAG